MSIVPVYRYASDEKYKTKNSIGGSYASATCSMADIVRYSLDNGDFEGHVVTSLWGQTFYRSIPLFALTPDMTSRRFLATDDYRHAEASYKGAVSFYLGMIGARLVFEEFLGGIRETINCSTREIVSISVLRHLRAVVSRIVV